MLDVSDFHDLTHSECKRLILRAHIGRGYQRFGETWRLRPQEWSR